MNTMIEKLRGQCRIDADDTTEDELLLIYYGAARRMAENFINRKLYEDEVPERRSLAIAIHRWPGTASTR
ncbi:TPA: phage gp6-like head-tail connector protein [Enterobacter kobei]|nr:phage gp6-like head-tail connector protein [Enterobacter kobei]